MAADVRGVGQIPQVVLDEPQHRVREHVVEAVVRLRVARHQAHLELLARGGAHGERAAAVGAGDLDVGSLIAEAIHTASRCDARPVSAVTRPPEPRCTSPPGWKVTGPRLHTSTSGARCAGALGHDLLASSVKIRK